MTCGERMAEHNDVSVARCDYGEVRVEVVSLALGEPLVVHVDWSVNELHAVINLVGEIDDQWVIDGALAWESSAPGSGRLNAVGERQSGLYVLAAVYEPSNERPVEMKPLMPPIVFEVRAAADPPRTVDELVGAREAVMQDRIRRYELGIGAGPIVASAIVFVKNLLMTTRINMGGWELIPIGAVGWSSELQVVDRELRALGISPHYDPDLIRHASLTEPAVLIKFPRVRGNSLEECANRALEEVNLLLPVLAAHRDSRGETFFVVVIGPTGSRYIITTQAYRGNLAGGYISGEAPEYIRRNMAQVKKHPNLRLFVSLLGEAIREEEPAFRYVRLWSLLETMAQAAGHSKAHVQLEWNGTPKLDRQGNPVTAKGAKASVFRLLSAALDNPEMPNVSPVDQIGIWYRRRNCVVHGDPGCICRDPLKKNVKEEYQNCLAARVDDQGWRDHHLLSLEQMAKDVVFHMLI